MKTILIIEDEKATRNLCCEILGEQYKTLEAATTIDGLRILSKNRPSLVITDLLIPNRPNGSIPSFIKSFDLIALLRLVDSDVKILIYSLLCFEPKFQELAIAMGASAYLSKLTPIRTLEETIDNLLEEKLVEPNKVKAVQQGFVIHSV